MGSSIWANWNCKITLRKTAVWSHDSHDNVLVGHICRMKGLYMSSGRSCVTFAPSLHAQLLNISCVWEKGPDRCTDVKTPRLMLNYIALPATEDPAHLWGFWWNLDYCSQITSMLVPGVNHNTTLWPRQICDFWVGAKRPSWMNEWVGPDINVVGALEIPPNDEFSMSESSHLFGKSSWLTTHRNTAGGVLKHSCALSFMLPFAWTQRQHAVCWQIIGSDI